MAGKCLTAAYPNKPLIRLTARAQFVRVSRAKWAARPSLVIQTRARSDKDGLMQGYRAGFTATKKTGNAVRRNRAKRRLRELARALLPRFGMCGYDYVFVARLQTADANWAQLLDEGKSALLSLQRSAKQLKPTQNYTETKTNHPNKEN